MQRNRLDELIEQSIRLEQNSAALYLIFHKADPDDADFWWQLHLEEKSHAMLLRAALDSLMKHGTYPAGIVASSIDTLTADNLRLEALIEHHEANPPDRMTAFDIALEIESSIGESHFDLFMDKEAKTPIQRAFQQLNRADKYHERRIRERLEIILDEA